MGCLESQAFHQPVGSYCLKGCALKGRSYSRSGHGQHLEAISMRSVGFPQAISEQGMYLLS